MQPLKLVFFWFALKTIIDTMIYLNLCLTTKTAIHFMKNSFLPLQHTAPFLFFFFTSTGTSLVKTPCFICTAKSTPMTSKGVLPSVRDFSRWPWMHPQYSNTPLVFSCRFSCSWSWQTWPSLPLGSALTWSKTFLVAEFLWSQEILLSTWKGGKNYDSTFRSMHKFWWLYTSWPS